MKKWLLCLLFVSPLYAADSSGPPEPVNFTIKDFSSGLYSYPSSNEIPDNAVTFIQNFYTDREPGLIERNGSTLADSKVMGNPTAVAGLWTFLDTAGTEWQIAFSSKTFYKRSAGQSFTAFGFQQTTTRVPTATQNLGRIWFVDGLDNLWSFDGFTSSSIAGAPIGTLITSWRNRLVIAGVANAQTSLYFSADGGGTNWILGGGDSDPFITPVNGNNDGYGITCLYGSYLDTLIIGRKYDTWGLYGFTQADYQLRKVSSEIGCISNGSMREFDGSLVFLSARGLEEMTGATIKFISEPIRDITDSVVKNTVNRHSWSQATQADFDTGLFNQTTSSGSPGYIQLPAFNTGDFQKAAFDAGTKVNTDSNRVPDKLYISTSNTDIVNNSFETNDGLKPTTGWTTNDYGGTWAITNTTKKDGSYAWETAISNTYGYYLKITGISTNTLLATSGIYKSINSNWTQRSYDLSPYVGQYIRLYIEAVYNQKNFFSDPFLCSGNPVTWWDYGAPGYGDIFDYFQSGRSTITVGTFLSQTFGGSFSKSAWNVSNATYTVNGSSIGFETQVSDDLASWDSLVPWIPGTAPTSNIKKYIKYKATIGISTNSTGLPYIDDVGISMIASTGIYYSAVNYAPNITAWDYFVPTYLNNGGTQNFYIRASTGYLPINSTTYTWTSIGASQIPSISTGAYFQIRDDFAVTSGVQNPQLDQFAQYWTEGSFPPLVSYIWDRRYWLALTTNTVSPIYLDTVLVYQRNRTFTLLKGLNAASFTRWNDGLYFGDSTGNTGNVYQFDVGNTDNGNPITSIVQTKSYDLGYPYREKDVRKMYVGYLGNTSYTGNFSLTYDMDRSGSAYSLSSANMYDASGQIEVKFPFPIGTNPLQGREIQYTLTKSGTGDRLKLYEFRTMFGLKEAR
jgi:hypothetical protein